MLSLALLLATLLETPKPAVSAPSRVACPATPAAFTQQPAARACPALEISGNIDATGVSLQPAFDVDVAPSELARPERTDTVLAGYAADGHTIFAQSFTANGPFHLYVPLSRALAQSVQRLRLVSGAASADVTATVHREGSAETLSLDSEHYLIAWNAREFPSLRINAPNAAPLLLTGSTSTYEQRTIDSPARAVLLEFSDGVRSTSRTIRVFGR